MPKVDHGQSFVFDCGLAELGSDVFGAWLEGQIALFKLPNQRVPSFIW